VYDYVLDGWDPLRNAKRIFVVVTASPGPTGTRWRILAERDDRCAGARRDPALDGGWSTTTSSRGEFAPIAWAVRSVQSSLTTASAPAMSIS
jgi:hypothetical protein